MIHTYKFHPNFSHKKNDGKFFPSQTVDKVARGVQLHEPFFCQSTKILNFRVFLINTEVSYASFILYFCFIFASFFKFIHAKVSPTFISIRALPYCWV